MEESIREALKEEGYVFEYDYGYGEDRTEVWVNEEAKMAVRIEWMKVDEEGWRR